MSKLDFSKDETKEGEAATANRYMDDSNSVDETDDHLLSSTESEVEFDEEEVEAGKCELLVVSDRFFYLCLSYLALFFVFRSMDVING